MKPIIKAIGIVTNFLLPAKKDFTHESLSSPIAQLYHQNCIIQDAIMSEQVEQNNELRDFIQETLRQVKEGVGEHSVHDQVHFKIAIAKTRTGEGKLGIAVLGIGELGGKGEVKIEHASEVGFSVDLKRESHISLKESGGQSDFDPSKRIG